MQNLFSSRRFWMVILDTVLSTISFIVAGYVADPKTAELIKFGVVTLQPIFVIIIGAYTFDDVAGLRANGKYPNA